MIIVFSYSLFDLIIAVIIIKHNPLYKIAEKLQLLMLILLRNV